jgi:tRNA (cmo5U34)-methyltransferase
MSASSHLGINLREYDARIRTFIPLYETMLDEAASTLSLAGRSRRVVDLGIGTGALSARVLAVAPRARIVGVEAAEGRAGIARGRGCARLTTVHGNFERVLRPAKAVALRADAITASLALHHVRTRRQKAALYRHAFVALGPGGLFVSADFYPASDPRLRRAERAAWRAHLEASYSRTQAAAFFRAWAKDDVHFPLDVEIAMLRAAGFATEIPWRVGAFTVVLALKRRRAPKR